MMSNHQIKLSTFHFFKGNAPKTLKLSDLSLKTYPAISDSMIGFWGKKALHQGILAAKQHAKDTSSQYLIIDFTVNIEGAGGEQKALPTTHDTVGQHDYVNLAKLKSDSGYELASMYNIPHDHKGSYNEKNELHCAIAHHVLKEPTAEHVKLLIFPSLTNLSDKYIKIGVIPHRFWDHITSANSILDSSIKMDLTPPSQDQKTHKQGADRAKPSRILSPEY